MPEKTKKQTIYYLQIIILYILALFLFLLPLLFLAGTTDAFILPKQILMAATVSITGILFGIKTLLEGKIKIRTTPLDLPIFLFVLVSFASAIFAVNQADSLIAFLPILYMALLYFIISNTVKQASQLLILLAGLTIGTALSALLSLLSFFNIYILPFSYTNVPYFNTFGSLLDQAIFFALILPITGYFVHSIFKNLQANQKTRPLFADEHKSTDNKITPLTAMFAIAFFIILSGLSVTVYQLLTTQKPLILPLETGLQTAFAAISQDTGRALWGFLLGSGTGTYLTDFTRYKPAAYNLDPNLWSFTFFRSSTYALEMLATTGILGIATFLFLIFKILKEKGFFLPLILAIIASLILPFSSTLLILFFVLLALFVLIHSHNKPHKFNDIELYFVALKRGLLATRNPDESVKQNQEERQFSKLLPILFFIITLILIGLPLYYSIRLFISDMLYQRSLVAYSQNQGLQAYQLQLAAVNTLPRDLYYRGLSQTNIALASSLAQQMQQSSPSAQDQQTLITLIQQAISSGRNAALISPQTSFNWSNLSNIYRNLIGFGQDAERFALITGQQAIVLDSNNPMQYIDLGGIYYQLGLYDDAIRQFQTAIRLKNDYANAYYNLGHALEMKGSLTEALAAYQIVKNLVANDQANIQKIEEEIKNLEAKISQQNQQINIQEEQAVEAPEGELTEQNEPLEINRPDTTLPERDPRISIPAPTVSIQPSPSKKPTTSITPTPTEE
jgi:tetratricopeptide (TPR) repeat protein